MIKGLDSLRIFALLLITWQHAASVIGYYEVTQWRGISPGQIGVSIFCAISGYLALAANTESPMAWLKRRLIRLFPAYWIVTIAAFVLVIVGSDKKVTLGQFVSQMSGLGFFTHGWELVNVVSWFISLILLCYLIVVISLKSGWPKLFIWAVFILAAILCFTRIEVSLSRHVLTFLLAAVLALGGHNLPIKIISGILIVVGILLDPQFFYSGVAIGLLLLVFSYSFNEPKLVKISANYGYEYFLVHGIFLVVLFKLIANSWLAIPLAVLMAIVAAFVLNRISEYVIQVLQNGSLRHKLD